jgi:hypothetical protein
MLERIMINSHLFSQEIPFMEMRGSLLGKCVLNFLDSVKKKTVVIEILTFQVLNVMSFQITAPLHSSMKITRIMIANANTNQLVTKSSLSLSLSPLLPNWYLSLFL